MLNHRHQPPKRSTPRAAVAASLASLAVLCTVGLQVQAADLPVSAQARSTAQQVASRGVAIADLAPGAPDVYTVKSGDTLWDVSKLYLKSPWRWPELWGMNLDQIRNPHLIYPGQVLVLDKSNGRARLTVGQAVTGPGDTVKLSPRIRESAATDAITTVPMHLIRPFLQEMAVFNADTLSSAPRIVAGTDNRVLIGRGDKAYVLGDVAKGSDWNVFRNATPLLDPRTKELLGYESRLLGSAQFTRPGETRTIDGKPHVVPATFTVTGVRSEIRAGDRLMPTGATDMTTYVPHAPSKPLSGQIISVYGDALIAGQNQIVALNRGAAEGVERGHVLSVLRDGRALTDRETGKTLQVKLPDERHGLMFVFRVFDRVSYALLLNTETPVASGDHFDLP